MTVFVERRNGVVVGVYARQQPGYAEEEIAADHPDVVAFLAPPPDPTLRMIHPFYFRLRFTQQQRTTFDLSTDPAVVELRARFLAASTIGLDDKRTSDGLDLMIAKGLIQPGDKAALLADRKPEEKP